MAKLKFRNGINGTLVDWTPDATLFNVGSIKRRLESKNPGEAGIIVFDKLGLTLGYEAGNNPVYNAFSGNLSAVQRYIFELHGIKTDKSESKLYEGLADLSTLEWPDMEKKISFNVLDKLSSLSLITQTAVRTSGNILYDVNTDSQCDQITYGKFWDANDFSLRYTNSGGLVRQTTEANTPKLGETIQIHFLRGQQESEYAQGLITFKYFDPTYQDGKVFYGVRTNYQNWYAATTDQDKSGTVDTINKTNSTWWSDLFNGQDIYIKQYRTDFPITKYSFPGRTTEYVAGYEIIAYDAIKIIEAIVEKVWGNITIVNKTGGTTFPISLDYFSLLLDENPFGMHPLDALRMLAGSMQCYVFFNKNGELVLQKKSAISSGTVRTFTPVAKKSGGKKKYFWDKLADAVTVTVKSGKIIDGITLTGTATVKKYPGIQPRNEIKIEIVAPSGVEFTQAALDTCALTVATEVMDFYGKRHFYFNLSTRLQDDMFDWDLLDLIDVNGERYFILSSDINETNSSATFELVSVTGYEYDFQQARAILSNEKYNSTFTSSSSSSSGSGTTISITALQPLEMVGSQIKLNYEDNLKLSTGNKLDTAQPIKTTSTPEFARIGVGGAADATYKVKNYGDEWIVGNQKIDGVQAIGGAVDTNFKQKIYGAAKITGNLTVDGDIYIGGSINRVNVVDLDISDHAIRLNKGGDNTTALDGGIEMLGASDVLLGSIKYNGTNWLSDLNFDIATGKTYKINNVDVLTSTALGTSVVSSSLTSIGTLNHDLNIANTKVYKINSVEVLNATTIGANVVNSSLTKVGTLTQGVWNATIINGQYLNYNTTNLKVTTNQLNTIQDIAITSSPTFTNITLSGRIDQQGAANSEFGSQSVLPKQSYYGNLGAINKKWLTLHAAELWVETLVAQDTIATIGGRVLVGATTVLVSDLSSGSTTINVKHNQMINGDVVYMEAEGKVEFMRINSSFSGSAGNYTYSVIRNLDGTGANDWFAGDAMFNTGQAGNGFIDLYSIRGIKSASQTGPTIVGNVRNSTTYNDWSEHWAIGNLNNLYGYTSNTYGVGLGRNANSSSFITVDATNGIRLRYKNSSGSISDKITLDMSGNVSIAGYLQVGNAASDVNNYSTTISGNKIRSGILQSNNWGGGEGSYFDLNNGTITLGDDEAPNFSVNATGAMTAKSGTIGGVSFNHEWLYMGTLAEPTIVINNTQKSIYVRPLGTGTNTKFVMVGQTHNGTNWTGYYGISAVDGNNNMLFRIDNSVKYIAGFNFDSNKFYLGSSTAGFALNTSSTPFITGNNSKGFEVYDVSNPKMFLGLRDGSGVLSAGYDWNVTTANVLTIKGKITTGLTFTWQGGTGGGAYAYLNNAEIASYNKKYSDSSGYTYVEGARIAMSYDRTGEDNRYFEIDGDECVLRLYKGGTSSRGVTLSEYGVAAGNYYCMRWRGAWTTTNRPTTDLREGDMGWNTTENKLQFVLSGSWTNEY